MLTRRMYPLAVPFSDLRRNVNRLFDEMTHDPRDLFGGRTFPALNVWEDGESFYVEAEVPGMTMEDLTVHLVGGELSITGERKAVEGENQAIHRRERATGSFLRSITLPGDVNADKIEAVLKNGVLIITLPKATSAKARQISVKAG